VGVGGFPPADGLTVDAKGRRDGEARGPAAMGPEMLYLARAMDDAKLVKVLSLDGGGSWALIQARALEKIFTPETRGHELLRHFDLVVANSGGSLVAAGLAGDLAPASCSRACTT
jgi:hypothetical protein